MKKILSLTIFSLLVICTSMFVGCGKVTTNAGGFDFTYSKNSAQNVLENNENYVKLMLEVKNKEDKTAEVAAQNFSLKKEGEVVSEGVYFGNNIIDSMEVESLDTYKSMKLVLSIKTQGELSGDYELFYGETLLTNINL